jgi:hypothetical protein
MATSWDALVDELKEWVLVPASQSDRWSDLAEQAI